MVVISLSSHTYVSHAEGYLKIVGKRLGKLWVELQHLEMINMIIMHIMINMINMIIMINMMNMIWTSMMSVHVCSIKRPLLKDLKL